MTTTHEQRLFRLVLFGGLPAVVVALWLLIVGDAAPRTLWTVGTILVGSWIATALVAREQVVRPLQTISNMIAALREQDYSLRARGARPDDALGLALWEVNTLSLEMHDRRLGALEAGALLRRVMAEIDVAVYTFDELGALRVVNAFGARLLGQPEERLLGRSAADLGLGICLEGAAPRIIDVPVGASGGRWELRRGEFRQDGRPHRFIVLADVSRTLREEERVAWQRLIRVLGHEINNSITPIQSLAGRLQELVKREANGESLATPLPGMVRPPLATDAAASASAGAPGAERAPSAELRTDLERGLGVITSRAEALTRFLASYTQLARLPAPTMRRVRVADWVQRVARLESRVKVNVVGGPDITIDADGDQLDQLLINLVKNAADAVQATHGGVELSWSATGGLLTLLVCDEGPGIGETANLFVPFYTTKSGGTGVGLVLSRQIAEAHGGSVTLRNRAGAGGCEARLALPMARPA